MVSALQGIVIICPFIGVDYFSLLVNCIRASGLTTRVTLIVARGHFFVIDREGCIAIAYIIWAVPYRAPISLFGAVSRLFYHTICAVTSGFMCDPFGLTKGNISPYLKAYPSGYFRVPDVS